MTEKRLTDGRLTVTVYSDSENAPLCLLLNGDGDCGQLYEKLEAPRPSLMSISGFDWDDDLSPWAAKRAFRGGKDFGGKADCFLKRLFASLPGYELSAGLTPSLRLIAGYSLAGLAAVYSLFLTDIFKAAVSASGSMWFDGFTDYIKTGSPAGEPEFVYFSLGDTEGKTKNARLASVDAMTAEASRLLNGKGIASVFEYNPGNHFADPDGRTAKGINTALKRLKS